MKDSKLASFNPKWAQGKTDAEIKEAHKHLADQGIDLDESIKKHRERHPVEEKPKKAEK